MGTLVLLRHGQSTLNLKHVFTGWQDPDMTDQGINEAKAGGVALREAGVDVDLLFTSLLRRAIITANLALETADRLWIPVQRHWRLNERHYGALQGRTHEEVAAENSDEQVHTWRRSYDVPPPPADRDSPNHPINDPRYADVDPELLPACESLKDVLDRVLPYWDDAIVPELHNGKTVMIAAHGNSLRALAKHLLHISDDDIVKLEIPTGKPWVFDLDDDYSVKSERYL
ncbi:MAG: 2,3-bisphosphoglycerate-dependent phosphoglycerate mutase [Actinomycetota bacterium]|jgi:2,3-bisphosphoglycerate-dependent phosphoglycerate mutase